MPGHDYDGPIHRALLQNISVTTPGVDNDESPRPGEIRVVEVVGERKILACGCGNFFFAAEPVSVCGHCGAEAATDGLVPPRSDD